VRREQGETDEGDTGAHDPGRVGVPFRQIEHEEPKGYLENGTPRFDNGNTEDSDGAQENGSHRGQKKGASHENAGRKPLPGAKGQDGPGESQA